jgi:hypothetical protein
LYPKCERPKADRLDYFLALALALVVRFVAVLVDRLAVVLAFLAGFFLGDRLVVLAAAFLAGFFPLVVFFVAISVAPPCWDTRELLRTLPLGILKGKLLVERDRELPGSLELVVHRGEQTCNVALVLTSMAAPSITQVATLNQVYPFLVKVNCGARRSFCKSARTSASVTALHENKVGALMKINTAEHYAIFMASTSLSEPARTEAFHLEVPAPTRE